MENTNQLVPPIPMPDSLVNIASGEDAGDMEWVPMPIQFPQESYMPCRC